MWKGGITMAVENQINSMQQPKFSVAIQKEIYQKLIYNTLGEQRGIQFIAAVSTAVANNPKLQQCDAGSIIRAALLGESLNLSLSPQLGQCYLIPYPKKQNGTEVYVAQFQLGYKGYLQLAIRSGYYKKINVLPIKVGELEYFDPLEEQIKVHMIEDEEVRENADTMGYYAMFEYLNGFKKAIYWSKKKMETHADTYSKAFSLETREKLNHGELSQWEKDKCSSFWYKNFDAMACKTMLRQLISKWGIMSIELQEAYEKDMSLIHEDGKVEYPDSTQPVTEEETTEPEPEMEYVQEHQDSVQQIMSNEEFFQGMEKGGVINE